MAVGDPQLKRDLLELCSHAIRRANKGSRLAYTRYKESDYSKLVDFKEHIQFEAEAEFFKGFWVY